MSAPAPPLYDTHLAWLNEWNETATFTRQERHVLPAEHGGVVVLDRVRCDENGRTHYSTAVAVYPAGSDQPERLLMLSARGMEQLA